MGTNGRTEMSAGAVDAFLGRHETGVLALARADEPYAVPVSYGYDGDDRRFYLRLVSTPDGEKRRFLSSPARLVLYADRDGDYRSVVATGPLERVDLDELTVEGVRRYGDTSRPLFEAWSDDREELDIERYRLNPASLTGRLIEDGRG